MASSERRKAAGAAGEAAPTDSERKPRRRRGSGKEDELKILRPVRLEFTIKRDGNDVTFAIPSEFSIGDVVDRGVLDDLEQFWHLTIAQLAEVVPGDVDMQSLFTEPRFAPYLHAATSASHVRRNMRKLTAKCARIVVDGELTNFRVTAEEIEQLSAGDSIAIALWYLRRYGDLANQSKNSLRTTQV